MKLEATGSLGADISMVLFWTVHASTAGDKLVGYGCPENLFLASKKVVFLVFYFAK